jgi:uncharacterized protein
MAESTVRKAPLAWWLGGLLLGLTQILAVYANGPLGVSTQFVIVDSMAIHAVAPEYAAGHPLISSDKYQTLGYGWWFDVGLVAGALVAAVVTLRWRISTSPVWWRASHGKSVAARMILGFVGGFLILLGARFAHGCTSGQFASGWAQLSVSALPFTVTLFGFGMITARLVYPKVPQIQR